MQSFKEGFNGHHSDVAQHPDRSDLAQHYNENDCDIRKYLEIPVLEQAKGSSDYLNHK